MDATKLKWYGVRCIFRWSTKKAYEERVIVVRAKDLDDAIFKAEEEAADYANTLKVEYTGYANAFLTDVSKISDGTEVYSLIRDSDLDVDDYLDKFFDTGKEHMHHAN